MDVWGFCLQSLCSTSSYVPWNELCDGKSGEKPAPHCGCSTQIKDGLVKTSPVGADKQFFCRVCYFWQVWRCTKQTPQRKRSGCQSDKGIKRPDPRSWDILNETNKSEHPYHIIGKKTDEAMNVWVFCLRHVCSKPWAYLLILTQSGGTMEDSEFFTSIRNWRGVRRVVGRDGWKNVSLLIKHTRRHRIIAVTESSTQIGPSISSHLSLTVTHTHTGGTSCPETAV